MQHHAITSIQFVTLKDQKRILLSASTASAASAASTAVRHRSNLGNDHLITRLSSWVILGLNHFSSKNHEIKLNFDYLKKVFWSTSFPRATTIWLWSTFSSHCPLFAQQRSWLTSATSIIIFYEIFLGMLGFKPGAAGWEVRMLPQCYAAPPENTDVNSVSVAKQK